MIKVGVTGGSGFIGYHLCQTLNLFKEEFTLVDFEKSFFNEKLKLDIHYNGLIGSLGLTYRLAIVEEKSNYNQSKPLKIN